MPQLRATLQHEAMPADRQVAGVLASEGLSRLFDIAVEVVAADADLDLEALLWTGASVRIDAEDGIDPLVWHGQIEEAEYLRAVGDHHRYRLRLRPLVGGLAYRVRSRTFQDQTAVQIVTSVFKEAGIPAEAVVWHLSASYPRRELCLQYRESELDFVLRLLEDEGIFFWFEHADDGHVLHLGDGPQAHEPMSEPSALSAARPLHIARESVRELVSETRVTSDAYAARDWSFERAKAPLQAVARASEQPIYERYEYPGWFADPNDGLRRARNRIMEAQVRRRQVRGRTICRRLAPGKTFTVVESPVPALDGDYLITATTSRYQEPRFSDAAAESEVGPFDSDFRAIPAEQEFRPARATPRPRICGRESAVVTGPVGEEIHVDEYGRIKLHFYWDREGKTDDKASFWIRVQQQNTSGNVLLPRVGWEVDVGFLDGDPDRPVVLQKLYNRDTMPPYALPDHKTQSALQSSTSPGGGGTNEIRLQDGNAGMELALHASRDFALSAGNDMFEEIAVDTHEEIGVELKTSVGKDETVVVGAEQSLSVTSDCTNETTKTKTVSVGAMDDWGITGAFSVTNDGNRREQVGGLMNVLANRVTETFNGNLSRTVGAALCINSGGTVAENVTGSKTELVGGAKIELIRGSKAENVGTSKILTAGLVSQKTGQDMAVSAGAAMTINVGGPIVEKVGEGYTLGAAAVVVTAAGGAELKVGGSKLTAKGGALKVKAGEMAARGRAQLQLKGRINYKK